MVYPKDFESKIGFDKLRQILIEKCVSQAGKAEVDKMRFSPDFEEVCRLLGQTAEMTAMKRAGEGMPGDTLYDIAPWLVELRAAGSFLPAEKLHKLGLMLETVEEVGRFFSSGIERNIPTPELSRLFGNLRGFPHIVGEINRCVDRYGEVKDNASDELYRIRRAIRSATGSMQSAMRGVLERAKAASIVERDARPAIRDGRMVIAVPAEKKRQISGIVHDESATGKTVFIEPAEVVEASNRLRELSLEEHREIAVILTGIAEMIRPEIDSIAEETAYLGQLDFIKAKADLAIETGGEKPVIERKPEIDWFHAIHPVLLMALRKVGKEVVPLTLNLDGRNRILVISGPNAGGKSVCLKTVGIIQYMTQCGLLPTLYSNSHIGVFENLLADIGDEQSLENDLSTYSSHLRNMKTFLANASGRTLILADEMGSGTEPQIGGALAQAILVRLGEAGCFGIVTTHYQNLKTFAEEAEGFVNGAMLYDRQHLRPTFQLSVGSPGSSFALEIARKIGLPLEVVESAKEIVGSDYVNTDKYLLDIARDRRYWANKRQSIKEKEHKLDNLLSKYEEKSDDLRTRRNEILNDARHEAREILKGANAQIEKTIRDIKMAEAERERTREARRQLEDYKAALENDQETADANLPGLLKEQKHKSRSGQQKKQQKKPEVKKDLEVGDYVKMEDGGVAGKILSIAGNKAEVAFGALRTIVQLSRLRLSSKPKESGLTQQSSLSRQTTDELRRRQLDFKQEIDVRGMRTDEALQAVTYFLDDAFQFGAHRLRILHGTGHGILKTMIRKHLDATPGVSRYRDEDIRFGGAGITIVEID
ncbi:MAG: endonuclease MutS2 [Bacteroides sp.]|nr:endonuclease MutS2 [Bacteroides sp.]